MSNVGYDTWYPKDQSCTVFIVKNIASPRKCVRIFNYPIGPGKERDILAIPYVSEADIRHSLLKGELNISLKSGEITVTESNIDLLQFDDCQKDFLIRSGIINGLEVVTDGYAANFPVIFRQNIPLVGTRDSNNRIFSVPTPDKFVNGTLFNNEFRILVRHNGKGLEEGIDYMVSESGGSGTGYDTIVMISFSPKARSRLIADYVVKI